MIGGTDAYPLETLEFNGVVAAVVNFREHRLLMAIACFLLLYTLQNKNTTAT
jgi:hypothetical protein